MSDRRLHIPQGTEAFHLDEAFTHQALLRSFEDACTAWAYSPVQTPVLDFHEVYRGLVSRPDESSSYRMVDRDGDLLVLRSDVTLFLARQMGLALERSDLPVRVFYGDTILRHEDALNPTKNEFFQVGAEFIGGDDVEADAEVILLLFDVLQRWKNADVVIHIGHRTLLSEFDKGGVMAPLVAGRMWSQVRTVLEDSGQSSHRIDDLLELYRFIGSPAELRALMERSDQLSAQEIDSLTHLLKLGDQLSELGYGDRFRVDLSEVGSQPYHSGVVFQGYAPDADAPLASGGRYNNLLAHFGFDAPSVGFSVMLRRLQSRLGTGSGTPRAQVIQAKGTTFCERVENARILRSEGKVVRL